MNPKITLLARLAQERFAREGRPRTPEPMAMNDAESVTAFDTVHPVLQAPIYRLNALALSRLLPEGGTLLDLGSGSGRLLVELALARPDVQIIGLELAPQMIAAARRALAEAGVADRVTVREGDMTALDCVTDRVDAVSCIWALHHLPDRTAALRCLREIARIRTRDGAAVWIFDFARLRRSATFRAVVDLAPDVSPRLRDDGIASEAAAWTAAELRQMLGEVGLGDLSGGPERRVGHLQAWTTGVGSGTAAHQQYWRAAPLTPAVAEDIFGRLSQGLPSLSVAN